MDCFCVGEPWNLQLIQDIGYTAVNTGEIWNKHPEKSLGMRAALGRQISECRQGRLMAVMEAQQWADKTENKAELSAIMGKRQWMNCPVEDVLDRTSGKFDYGIPGKVVENSPHIMKYWRDHASYPFQSHELWFLTEDIRWGKYEPGFDTKALIKKVNREDLWREAAKSLGVAAAIFRRRPRAARKPSSTQGLRSGKSRRLPQEPRHQARRSVTANGPPVAGGPASSITTETLRR